MNNPIIEKLRASIQDPRTADHFSEVLSCYYSGNFRSAIVMLYATTICDLVYKLENLRDLYNDTGAKQILEDLEKQQKANPKNTDWEKDIPEKCKNSNKILTTADYSNFESLQQLRHLCAHPVLSETKQLYKPNADIVLGHIRNMLEGILMKPAFQTKELFKMFVEDIAKIKGILIDHTQFKQYVNSKYFDNFNSMNLEYSIFKNLWKFVFKLDNDDCNDNRKINLETIYILLSRHADYIISQYENDNGYFARNVVIEDRILFVPLIKIFNEYPKLFEVLPNDRKIEIEGKINKDNDWDYKAMALFLQKDILSHVLASTYKDSNNANYIAQYISRNIGIAESIDFIVKVYGESGSFNTADWRYDNMVLPSLKNFSEKQLEALVVASNNNCQIYCRRKATSANNNIKEALLKKNPNFDFSQYIHFEC